MGNGNQHFIPEILGSDPVSGRFSVVKLAIQDTVEAINRQLSHDDHRLAAMTVAGRAFVPSEVQGPISVTANEQAASIEAGSVTAPTISISEPSRTTDITEENRERLDRAQGARAQLEELYGGL